MMHPNQIAVADILDIVFEGLNKAYGAYQVQKHYNDRLKQALFLVISFSLFAAVFSHSPVPQRRGGVTLIPGDSLIIQPPPSTEKPQTRPQVSQAAHIHFATPLIVKDNLADDSIPPVDTVASAVIAFDDHAGQPTPGNAPSETAAPALNEPPAETLPAEPQIFEKAEFPAEFPGGTDGWRRYLEKNIHYPDEAIENEIEATIKVQFIVDTEGNISEVQSLNDPGYGLAEEAVRIIRTGPKWKPAEQNHRKVIFRHIQGISFRLR